MELLNRINSPSDLTDLSAEELRLLTAELRSEIIRTVSKNGGHLASNLGIVELTLALHLSFSVPADSLVFDVGHQAYAHKLITGRREAFPTLRQQGGISGFTNREESPYDIMTAGHSGASLSYAIGIAEANRIADREAYTVAVIGDGSFTNGMIYEALNNAATNRLRLIIVLNDNEMSISPNVGSLSRYFSRIRTGKTYFTFKMVMKRLFSAIPLVGNGLITTAKRFKNFCKRVLITENLFENLGLEFFGPVAGDRLDKLCDVLAEAKQIAAERGAVVVHVNTKKGMGYRPAEDSPDRFHSTGPFPVDCPSADHKGCDGKPITFTEAFSHALLGEAAKDERICAVTAAMTDGCGLVDFKASYPRRFFDTGIAEEHAVTMAGGLSYRGMKPVVAIYSTFMQRTFDQVWHDVALQGGNVVLVLSHSGIVPAEGVTHQGIYDVALFSPIPGVTIYSPSCCQELGTSLSTALSKDGVSILRYPKGGDTTYPKEAFEAFDGGRIKRFGTGKPRLLTVTYGRLADQVYDATETFATEEGLPCAMAVLCRIMPVPQDFYDLCAEANAILFAEEGIRTGGIGETVAAYVAEHFPGKTVSVCAIENGFLPHDCEEQLLHRVGLDKDTLVEKMKKAAFHP